MRATPALIAAVSIFMSNAPALEAATHEVNVVDRLSNPAIYVPSFISIAVGDTVRWTNFPGGSPHDVTANDLSWASPTGSEFVYERTFNTVGDFGYHCAYHDPYDFDGTHYGNVRVTGEAVTLEINAGLNDAWYNPATAGQGFFITVFPDSGQVFLAWFTYDTERPPENVQATLGEPGHRWLTAFGPYSDNTAVLDVELTQGGVFDAAEPGPTQSPAGTITLEFSDCENGLVSYDITPPGVQGEVPIQRIAPDNVPACEALQ